MEKVTQTDLEAYGKELTRLSSGLLQKVQSAEDTLKITQAALSSAIGNYTFMFRKSSSENRSLALHALLNLVEDILRCASEQLLKYEEKKEEEK